MVDFGQIKSVGGNLLPGGGVKDFINSGGQSLLTPDSPISRLMAEISKAGGLTQPNQFDVVFTFPSGLPLLSFLGKGNFGSTSRSKTVDYTSTVSGGLETYQIDSASSAKQVMMSCEQAAIPSKSVHTTQTRYYGPEINYAYAQNFANLDMIFRVHNNMIERKFFEAWQESAVNSDTYDANYYDEYVAQINIRQYGPPEAKTGIIQSLQEGNPILGSLLTGGTGIAKSFGKAGQQASKIFGVASAAFNKYSGTSMPNGKIIAEYSLIDAFPKLISQLALDHKTQNMYHRQQITFEFRKWKTNLAINSNKTTSIGVGERAKDLLKRNIPGGAFPMGQS